MFALRVVGIASVFSLRLLPGSSFGGKVRSGIGGESTWSCCSATQVPVVKKGFGRSQRLQYVCALDRLKAGRGMQSELKRITSLHSGDELPQRETELFAV